MKTSNYFKKRAEQRMDKAHLNATQRMFMIDKHMRDSMAYLKQDIMQLLVKIDPNPNEARRLLEEKISNEEYDKLLQQFKTTKNKAVKLELKKRLKTEALKPRISRKGALYSAIDRARLKMTDYQTQTANKHLKNTVISTMQHRMSDYPRPFAYIDEDHIESILTSKWLGENYSSRIWKNQEALAEKIKESVVQQYITGKPPNLIGRDLLTDDNVEAHRYNVARIMRTETSYIVNKTELEDAKRLGITKRKFIATIDSRTSKVCSKHNGMIIPIDKCVIGKNVPPLHPFCRSFMEDYIPGLSDSTEWEEPKEIEEKGSKIVAKENEKAYNKGEKDIKLKKGFKTTDDPVRKVMGSMFDSHPKETEKILNLLKSKGIEVEVVDKEKMVYMPAPNRPGKLMISRNASYSALLHENRHALDDIESNFTMYKAIASRNDFWKYEEKAYNLEIAFCEENGVDEKIIKRIEKLKQNRKEEIDSWYME